MPITARTGTGTLLTFSGGFTCIAIDSITPFAQTLGTIDANKMTSGPYMEKIFEDLIDLGEASIPIEYDPEETPPPLGEVQTLTINPKGLGAGALIRGTGAITGASPAIPVNGKMTQEITWTWDGDEFEVNAS